MASSILHWKPNDVMSPGDSIIDLSGNNHDILVDVNTPNITITNNILGTGSFDFVDRTKKFEITGFDVPSATLSFALFLHPISWHASVDNIFLKRPDPPASNLTDAFFFFIHSADSQKLKIDHGGANYRWDTGYSMTLAQKHIAYVYDGTDQILYADGIEVARRQSATVGSAMGVDCPLRMGLVPENQGAYSFRGYMDDVRFYNTDLSPSEVYSLCKTRMSLKRETWDASLYIRGCLGEEDIA